MPASARTLTKVSEPACSVFHFLTNCGIIDHSTWIKKIYAEASHVLVDGSFVLHWLLSKYPHIAWELFQAVPAQEIWNKAVADLAERVIQELW